jgi:hypothetical protein
MLRGIIDTLDQREDANVMVNIVGAAIFDYDLELLKRLYRTINASTSLEVNQVMMNYFVWGALHFNDQTFQAELMFHASLMGYKIDL